MTDTETKVKPNDRMTVEVNGQPQEVFMSGGLVRNIMRHFSQFDDFGQIFTNAEEQNVLIIQLLRPRNKSGSPAVKVNYSIDDFEMSIDDSAALVSWAVDHCLHFFMNSVSSATNLFESNKDNLVSMMKSVESTIGSKVSPDVKQSAGLSDAAPAA